MFDHGILGRAMGAEYGGYEERIWIIGCTSSAMAQKKTNNRWQNMKSGPVVLTSVDSHILTLGVFTVNISLIQLRESNDSVSVSEHVPTCVARSFDILRRKHVVFHFPSFLETLYCVLPSSKVWIQSLARHTDGFSCGRTGPLMSCNSLVSFLAYLYLSPLFYTELRCCIKKGKKTREVHENPNNT